MRGSITCPEAVQVAGNASETGDLGVSDEVVDFRALDPRAAVVAAPNVGETARWPLLLGQAGRQVLRIGAMFQGGLRTASDLPGRG